MYFLHLIRIYPGITRGGMLSGELYIQTLQKLICLSLSTDCFMKISLYSSGPGEWREIFMKQSVPNTDKVTSVIAVYVLRQKDSTPVRS